MTDTSHIEMDSETVMIGPAHLEQVDLYALNAELNQAIKKFALKSGETFMVADVRGDLRESEQEIGFFWQGTRYLNNMNLFLAGKVLSPLSYSVTDDGDACQIDLCNPYLPLSEDVVVQPGALHIRRLIELQNQQMTQTITVTSFHHNPVTVLLGLKITADYRDIFEIRGMHRDKRGTVLEPIMELNGARLRYKGRDNVIRETHFTFALPVTHIVQDGIFWELTLYPNEPLTIPINVEVGEDVNGSISSSALPTQLLKTPHLVNPTITSSSVFFDRLLKRSMRDLGMMTTMTPHGYFPYAGLPWFVCPFGRDGLITSLQFLPWFPEVARGTLAFLAYYQGKKEDTFTEEEPGKILHEYRKGEMANCREIPFIPYFGTIDATPLFLILLEHYIRWTNDMELLHQLWPNAIAAAQWMIDYGDLDGDGFLEYRRLTDKGLINQGWKDSLDAVSHENGTLAEAPIALCEVQGYAYAAFRGMAYLASRIGKKSDGNKWNAKAEQLYRQFQQKFVWKEANSLYMALDGNKEPCKVVTSNVGHCLWSGIVPDELAAPMIARLMEADMYSGWGIRTLSSKAARYNPMSYHNGSVWPHDSSIVASGFARYGHKREAGKILGNLFGISLYYEHERLPELLCGFDRPYGHGPTEYPVACAPQSWATGAPFLLLSSILGMAPDAEAHRLVLNQPTLPDWLNKLEVHGIRVGKETLSLRFACEGDLTSVTPLYSGNVDLRIVNR